jgi:basic amino acid/polyamine antiporter, APA family
MATTSTGQSKGAAGGLYLRKATGLVREITMSNIIVYNMLPAVPGLILAFSLFWILGAFPGVNMLLGMVIALVLGAFIATAFGLLAVAMPRTGGDYILVSRTLHPALGMVSSISLMFSGFLSIGYWGWAMTVFGLVPAFKVVGSITGNATLMSIGDALSGKGAMVIVGLVAIGICVAMLSTGIRNTMKVQMVLWWVAFGGLAIMAVILLFNTSSTFVASFNAYAGQYTGAADSYQYMIDQAAAAGMQWPGTYSFGPTLAAVGALLTFGMWSWWSVHMSGEIKGGATRKQWYAILWATLIQYVIFIVMTILLYKTVGQQFIASVNYLSTANPAAYALPAPPYLVLLTSVIPSGLVLPFIISFAFIAWIPLVHYIQFVQPIRAFFAMAFDRVAPAKLADVNERTHAPITGLVVCTIIGVACLIWAVFSPTFMTVIVIAGLFGIPPITLVGVSAIVFPYRLKDLYKTSAAKLEVVGIPLVVIAGVVSVLTEILYGYVAYTYLLPHSQWGLATIITLSVIVISAILYYVAYSVRKREGIDISLVFKELPPE